jgi:DNA-binding NarL/FixJ family response regulator
MSRDIRILIVDDHKMVRDGIRSMLEFQESKFKFFINEASDGEEGVEMAGKNPYDIIMMDYQLPGIDGADAARLILEKNPDAKILALSNYNEYMYIDRMIKTGVKGFVLKNVTPEELIKAIDTILNGSNYFSNDVAIKLLNFENTNQDPFRSRLRNSKTKIYDDLSTREMEVLKLIGEAKSNDEIADQLSISKRTVETHKQHLLRKIGVKNTSGLIKFAVEMFQE